MVYVLVRTLLCFKCLIKILKTIHLSFLLNKTLQPPLVMMLMRMIVHLSFILSKKIFKSAQDLENLQNSLQNYFQTLLPTITPTIINEIFTFITSTYDLSHQLIFQFFINSILSSPNVFPNLILYLENYKKVLHILEDFVHPIVIMNLMFSNTLIFQPLYSCIYTYK